MHLYEQSQYPNLLENISLKSCEIENSVSSYQLTFSEERNKTVEWGIRLPMFVDPFYQYIIKYQSIPSQEEFYEQYILSNKVFFEKLNRPDLRSGIMARVFRTYPSLVRDIHFSKFIEEKLNGKCQIIYNTKLDTEEGIDLMIVSPRNNYGICFFTNTRRAIDGRMAKKHRHTPFENVIYVEMPINFKGSVKAGHFFLYGQKEFCELYNTLKNNHGLNTRRNC